MAPLTLTAGQRLMTIPRTGHPLSILGALPLREIAMSMHPGTAVANFLRATLRRASQNTQWCAQGRAETHLGNILPYAPTADPPISLRIIHHKCRARAPL